MLIPKRVLRGSLQPFLGEDKVWHKDASSALRIEGLAAQHSLALFSKLKGLKQQSPFGFPRHTPTAVATSLLDVVTYLDTEAMQEVFKSPSMSQN